MVLFPVVTGAGAGPLLLELEDFEELEEELDEEEREFLRRLARQSELEPKRLFDELLFWLLYIELLLPY